MKWYGRKLTGVFLLAIVAVVMILTGRCAGGCGDTATYRTDTVTVEKWDTMTVTVHDTVPQIRNERIVKYIPMPAVDTAGTVADTLAGDAAGLSGKTAEHSDSMAVVQREFSDDSTYTAWVSGIRYGEWPKLDSISVRRSIVTHRIRETVTRTKERSRWGISITAGPMFDVIHGQAGAGIMIGVSYELF